MIKIERPDTIEETKWLVKNIKKININLRNCLSVAEQYIDDVLLSLSNDGNTDFYLKEAEKYLAKTEEYKVDIDDQTKFNDCPSTLKKAVGDNYFEQGVTYYKLEKRLNAVKSAVALATKQ